MAGGWGARFLSTARPGREGAKHVSGLAQDQSWLLPTAGPCFPKHVSDGARAGGAGAAASPWQGVSGGRGAQAPTFPACPGLLGLRCCGPTEGPWDEAVSGLGSPAPMVFLAGGREQRRPGPGQHSGQWPWERSGLCLPSQVLALSPPASARRGGSIWCSRCLPSWETEVRAQAGILLP